MDNTYDGRKARVLFEPREAKTDQLGQGVYKLGYAAVTNNSKS